ncbi:MAG: heavy metal translocating P-type ATPase metal-binding domain-containing protein [Rhodospirillales bacterium]|nr:heavy metal translocating P-type ATPase metal-binding domain-containing protein [Rhodospirillales bacterium]
MTTGVAAVAPSACAHCGTALARGETARFCCAGCAKAHDLIAGLGLASYYSRRVLDAEGRPPRPEALAATVEPPSTDARGLAISHYLVDGLHCAACVWLIEQVLQRQDGVESARLNMTTRRLTVRWRPGRSDDPAATIAALGYRAVAFDPAKLKRDDAREETELLRCLAVAGFAAGNIMLLSVSVWSGALGEMGPATRDLMHWVSALIALPAVGYAGRPFFRSAVRALAARRTNMDVPISLGVILATLMSLAETAGGGAHAYFDSAVTLLFFLLVGRYLDRRARGQARGAATQLAALDSTTCQRIDSDGAVRRVPSERLRQGDLVLVAAGERVPADGRIASGRSSIDRSVVSGESDPVAVATGDAVFAGTVNLGAALRVEVTAAGKDTLLAEIVRLMETAEQGRARYVVLADRVARLYAPVVHVLALLTFLGWTMAGAGWHQALLNAVAVLIITCPCALALAVPVVQVVATGRLMRRGILLKSATALERLAEVDRVVFDKTGTLTLGRPVLTAPTAIDAKVLTRAAAIAATSRHPLSRALAQAAEERLGCPVVPAEGVIEVPGQGLARGDTRLGSRGFCAGGDADGIGPELWLAEPGTAPLRFVFTDRPRSDAAETIATLAGRGYGSELLSGDRDATVAAVARETGIAEWRAAQSPVDKVARLKHLAEGGARPLMVGDGINDAPALAAAHVSASPASASDIARVAADVVFQGDRLGPVAELLAVARSAATLVRQNLALAILYNLVAVPLAMAGYLTPLIAAIAMSSSSLLVVGNALRLRRGG